MSYDTKCIHDGVECEHNVDSFGTPTCPCRCEDCSLTNYEFDDEYDAPVPIEEFDPATGYSPKDDWLKD